MSSQGVTSSGYHRIELPNTFISRLSDAKQTSCILGRLSKSDIEDFTALFPRKTTKGLDIDELIKVSKYFIRRDACSFKDALLGSGHAKDSVGLWTRLATSAWGVVGVQDLRAHNPSKPVHMWLLPLREMDTRYEYRVFCPPSEPNGTRIAATS